MEYIGIGQREVEKVEGSMSYRGLVMAEDDYDDDLHTNRGKVITLRSVHYAV